MTSTTSTSTLDAAFAAREAAHIAYDNARDAVYVAYDNAHRSAAYAARYDAASAVRDAAFDALEAAIAVYDAVYAYAAAQDTPA